MCFSETSSLAAFSVSVAAASYLFYYGNRNHNKLDIWAAVITFMIGTMQLVEFFLWRNQDCGFFNHLFSLMVVVVLFLQASVTSIVYTYFFNNHSVDRFFITWEIGLYAVVTAGIVYWLNRQMPMLCSRPSHNSCRLVWESFHRILEKSQGRGLFTVFTMFYFGLFYYSFGGNSMGTRQNSFWNDIWNKYPVRLLILPVTFFVAVLYSFIMGKEHFVDIFGSFWCFLAVSFGVVSCLHI
jgi:hypothetical protein